MDAADFKAWRESLGLSQRKAAKTLGVSAVTIQLYERGFRHDDGRPVIIPERIALACEAVTRRRSVDAPETARLPHMQVPEHLLQPIDHELHPVEARRGDLRSHQKKPPLTR